jgi:Xaa-Pro aminopeptidase
VNGTLQQLIEAEKKALFLFQEAEERKLIVPGKSEKQLNAELYELAFQLFGIKKYWHKRIVRAGKNTLFPYRENPPDLMLQNDDILFFDFGPVFKEWEADVGRTYVLGNDGTKLKLKNDVESAWKISRDYYFGKQEITGSEFYRFIAELAKKFGWAFGGGIAGHLIGNFPHEKIEGDGIVNYIHPDNHINMLSPGESGSKRNWILEIHFINAEKQIGGFFEQILM